MILSEKQAGLIPIILGLFITIASPLYGDYLWPLPASHELTAHFCDYRGGHYHSGIDIRTFGKTGYNVVAIEDGYLMRVASNWWGYGNAVYLKLADGNIAVYGHLSEFTPEVEEYVHRNQKESRSFKVNLFPEENRFRFKKGDLIGKSGQSGSGAPHLHFEVRDPNSLALNPLPFYSGLKDNRAPRFEEITFRPLDAHSFVEGKARPYTIRFAYNKEKNNYYITEIPSMRGKIGVEIKVADRRSGTDRKYNVSGLEFFLEDNLVFETLYDTVSFDAWGLVDLDYNVYQRIRNKDFYHNLYYPDGQKSTAQNPDKSCGSCCAFPLDSKTLPGIYIARIYANDKNGNRREANLKIRILPEMRYDSELDLAGTSPRSSTIGSKFFFRRSDNADFSASVSLYNPDSGKFIFAGKLKSSSDSGGNAKMYQNTISNLIHEKFSDYPMLRLDFGDGENGLGSYLMGLNFNGQGQFIDSALADKADFIDKVDFISSEPMVEISPVGLYDFLTGNKFGGNFLQPIESGAGIRFQLPLQEPLKEFAYGRDFLPIPSYLALEKLKTQNYCLYKQGSPSEYVNGNMKVKLGKNLPFDMLFKFETGQNSGQTDEVRLAPDDRMIAEGMEISGRLPASYPAGKTGFYGIARNGTPGFVGADRGTDGYIKAVVRSLGTYRLMVDTIAPVIRNITPANNTKTGSSRPNISFYMDDKLSGFDSDTLLVVTIDGEYQICEYDVDNEIVYVRLTGGLKAGNHEMVIIARDRMGNTTTKKSAFIYDPSLKK